MKQKLILIRHGKTKGNEERRYIGRNTDEDLSDMGIRELYQKRDSLRSLADANAAIYSGPLKRANSTARLIFDDKPVTVIDELTEMDFGRFEGKNYEQLKDDPAYIKWVDDGGKDNFPDGETKEVLNERSLRGIYKILGEGNAQNVVFCHGGNIMAIMSCLTGKDYFDFLAANLGGYILEAEFDDERILDISYRSIDDGVLS